MCHFIGLPIDAIPGGTVLSKTKSGMASDPGAILVLFLVHTALSKIIARSSSLEPSITQHFIFRCYGNAFVKTLYVPITEQKDQQGQH